MVILLIFVPTNELELNGLLGIYSVGLRGDINFWQIQNAYTIMEQ